MDLVRRVGNKTVVTPEGCWEWQGQTDKKGYGRIWTSRKLGKRRVLATHRVVFGSLIREMGYGNHIHHLCKNKSCHNPSHLVEVGLVAHTRLTPSAPAYTALATGFCKNGHELTPENTYLRKRRQGGRYCKRCGADSHIRARRIKRETKALS